MMPAGLIFHKRNTAAFCRICNDHGRLPLSYVLPALWHDRLRLYHYQGLTGRSSQKQPNGSPVPPDITSSVVPEICVTGYDQQKQ